MQGALAILLVISFYGIEDLFMTILRKIDNMYAKKHGLSKASCCQFIINQVIRFASETVLNRTFIAVAATLLLTATEKYFVLAVAGAALIV